MGLRIARSCSDRSEAEPSSELSPRIKHVRVEGVMTRRAVRPFALKLCLFGLTRWRPSRCSRVRRRRRWLPVHPAVPNVGSARLLPQVYANRHIAVIVQMFEVSVVAFILRRRHELKIGVVELG